MVPLILSISWLRFAGMQDFETQLNNVNIVRVYQKLNFEYARAKHTFHAWLK
jgi:hypothetical protein